MNANLRKYLFLLLLVSLSACNLVRHVPQDELLLRDEVKIKGNKSLDLESSIRTKPNGRVIWPKFYLMLYNAGESLEQDSSFLKKWFIKAPARRSFFYNTTNWLTKKIGEPPVIVQPEMLKSDSLNIVNTYAANGFFDTQVTYQVEKVDNYFEHRRGKVSFSIEEGKAFYIRKIWLTSELEQADQAFQSTITESYIKVGERFKYQNLALERTRFANDLRTKGFFTFSPNSIHFQVDTIFDPIQFPIPEDAILIDSSLTVDTLNKKWLDIIVDVRDAPSQYTITEVEVVLEKEDSPDQENEQIRNADKVPLRGSELTPEKREAFQLSQRKLSEEYDILFQVSPQLIRQVNYNFIAERIYFKRGELYNRKDAILTQEELQELSMFQYVLTNYDVDEEKGEIQVRIQCKFAPKFEFKTGIEAYTNAISTSFTLPIFGASMSLRNKNAFRRSELLELSLGGDIGRYPVNINDENIFWQIQGKGNINFPRFILPFPKTWLPERYQSFSGLKPTTAVSISGLSERREEFNRLNFLGNVNYRWFNKPRSQQEQTQLSPLNIEYIDYELDPAFQQVVDDLPAAIRRVYQSRFNSWLSANYAISNYGTTQSRPTFFSKINYEGGGNIPRLIELLSPSDTDKTDSRLILRPGDSLGLAFGQYVKLWWEGKTQVPFTKDINLVLRAVVGGALPFGRTSLVPIERRFFAGGPSSMRGWQSNTLGPGTFPLSELLSDGDEDVSSLLAIGGEYLLEMNAELRFHVWSYLDMAIFTDVGNVWINPQREGSSTDPNNFNDPRAFLSGQNLYPGWDAGIGFRLDFSFLILRIDIAQQLFDPARLGTPGIQTGWVIQNFPSDVGGNSSQIHVGIGYPF